jgi:hypothetical protein
MTTEVSLDAFDEDTLLAEARESAGGLADFGPGDFRPGLRALCESYRRAPLSVAGAKRSHRRLRTLLATRLRVQEGFRRHPEIRERLIDRPMVLTGLPRTGTSALLNLLARDPAARPLLFWETSCPDPLQGRPDAARDPRRASIVGMLDRHRKKNPDFDSIHYAGADTPEECVLLQAHGFHGVQQGVEVFLEPYASYFRTTGQTALYRYYADLIRMLDWQRPGTRWLLKSPAHLWALDELVAVFPDVSIVWSHRNPLDVIASVASITIAVADTMVDLDARALGPRVLDFYAHSLERGIESRAAFDPARFFDVDHGEFSRDPLGVAADLYGHFGLSLDPNVRASMKAHVEEHPPGRHGSHEYDLARFGLDDVGVRQRFCELEATLAELRAASRKCR